MNERSESDARLLERSKRDFDAAVAATDRATALRLGAARARAVERAGGPGWLPAPRLWVPAAALAGLAAIVLVPRLDSLGPAEERDFGGVAAADLELLLGEEELEMLAELEFYEWLETQEGSPTDDEARDGVG